MPSPKSAATKPASQKPESLRLTRDDWLDAAFQAVVKGGFDHAKVLTLADALGVTRGSFYWHFADHAELIKALVDRWLAREIELDQQLQSNALDDPQADLEKLLDAALEHAGVQLENMRFELALRGLGRRSPEVAQILVDVDQSRMRLFETKFLRLTGDAKAASDLAALFYLAIVGSYQALSRPNSTPQTKAYFKRIIASYLVSKQKPGDA
jgi:AcrR family transcriptional regulator